MCCKDTSCLNPPELCSGSREERAEKEITSKAGSREYTLEANQAILDIQSGEGVISPSIGNSAHFGDLVDTGGHAYFMTRLPAVIV